MDRIGPFTLTTMLSDCGPPQGLPAAGHDFRCAAKLLSGPHVGFRRYHWYPRGAVQSGLAYAVLQFDLGHIAHVKEVQEAI